MRLPGRPAGIIILIVLILPISACAQPPENCPPPTPVDISDIEQVAFEQDSPFRFPLDDYRNRLIN